MTARQLLACPLLAVMGVIACGAANLGAGGGGGGGGGTGLDAAAAPCTISFADEPAQPVAGAGLERVIADVSPSNTYTVQWTVTDSAGSAVAFTQVPGPAIDFSTPAVDSYNITAFASSDALSCSGSQQLNIMASGANTAMYNVRVTPYDGSGVQWPPYETSIDVLGGGNQSIPIAFPTMHVLAGTVVANGSAIAAYVRAAPQTTPPDTTVAVDTYSSANGFGPLVVTTAAQDVLVVPTDPTLVPHDFTWTSGAANFVLDGGTAITGSVVGPGGSGIAGATVQVMLGGELPSTVATTASTGAFTVHADLSNPMLTGSATVQVVPPASSGLPRLVASGAFALGSPIAIAYPAVTTRNLANLKLTQNGSAVAGAQVAVVGTLSAFAATIAGSAATNTVLVGATTNASGVIAAATIAPAAPVSIVATLPTGEVEVVAVDLTSGVPATVLLPTAATATGIVTDAGGNPLAGVSVGLQPSGALALAGALPVQATTGSDGSYTVSLAASGLYDVTVLDFAARGPLLAVAAQSPAQIASFALGSGIEVDGVVLLPDTSLAVGASVQLLCSGCTGVAAAQPVAESSTDSTGTYRVSVVDPGVQ